MADVPVDDQEWGFDDGSAPRRCTLEVSLPQFEGPLDLLLHMVRSQDLDILDLPIVVIARQYNAYLDRMRELNLEIAAEYLVMATTLTHIKSQMMLPVERGGEGENADDPRAELTRQLLEHERFRKAAESLAALESGRDLVFARLGPAPPELAGEFTIRADLTDLVRAFEEIVRKLEADERVEVIRRDDFKVQEMMQRLLDHLERVGGFSFRGVAAACRTRLERVSLFLALLELMRLGAVSAWQTSLRGDIRIESMPAEVGES